MGNDLTPAQEKRFAREQGVAMRREALKESTPILNRLLAAKIIRVCNETGDFVATASDGCEVQVGSINNKQQTERYLRDHPTSDTW